MKKRFLQLMAFICILALYVGNVPAVQANDAVNENIDYQLTSDHMLSLPIIASGNIYSQVNFQYQENLSVRNGSKVNFWIQNNGRNYITTSINNQVARTFAPGEQGHITAPVSGDYQSFIFRAYPTYGGLISMQYAIRQR
ncbi:MAG: hypothetical protein E7K64_04435 [Clostridia bacterium]|nr:hypothetical protein [Peptococcus niger]MDU7244061.1 hypothetical protein [Clostridiales bacterium]MDU7505273.1 hypothetical protein [Clostridia bacterium]